MPLAEQLLAEFELQAPLTRRFLERLPEDRLTWRPHVKSMTAGQLAYHLATVPGGVIRLVQNNPVQRPTTGIPEPTSKAEILAAYEASVATVRELLPKLDDHAMHAELRMVGEDGGEIFSMPRGRFLRDIMLSHWYQHRGQFSVYLRLLGVPVPATWGPSGDEPPLFARAGV